MGRPCWLPNFLTDSPPDRVSQIRLKPAPECRGKMLVRGRGPLVAPGYLPFTPPVVAQLVAESVACWEATYGSPLVNGPDHFKARVDQRRTVLIPDGLWSIAPQWGAGHTGRTVDSRRLRAPRRSRRPPRMRGHQVGSR